MTRIYLPRHEIEKRQIVKRLREEFQTYVPGWQQLDASHLRDILQKEEALSDKPKPPKPESKLSKDEIRLGLKDYLAWRRLHEDGGRRLF